MRRLRNKQRLMLRTYLDYNQLIKYQQIVRARYSKINVFTFNKRLTIPT